MGFSSLIQNTYYVDKTYCISNSTSVQVASLVHHGRNLKLLQPLQPHHTTYYTMPLEPHFLDVIKAPPGNCGIVFRVLGF